MIRLRPAEFRRNMHPSVDVYVAGGVDGLCVSHSTGGEGFSDAANAL